MISGGKENTARLEPAKNGETTCRIHGTYLHSKYNPTREAEQFARVVKADFLPLCIIIIGPALSYCAPFLRKRFQNATLCAVHITEDFHQTDNLWDYSFSANKFCADALFFALGEERLCSCLVYDWQPSKNLFPDEFHHIWLEIKRAVEKSRDVLATRAFFAKRWIKNTLIFAREINHALTIVPGNSPVVVSASGPSLASSLPFFKKHRGTFFLVAVSSALKALSAAGIAPDLVISSDGGYWAKRHLDFPGEASRTVYGIETEGASPCRILAEKNVLPLCYTDGTGKKLLESIGCPYTLSERNGTVAGTALHFALALTTGNVYICGFDQAPASGFQHVQPNELEAISEKNDFRLCPKESRTTAARFSSQPSLEIYRNYFVSHSELFAERVSRLSDHFRYEFSLGRIVDISWQDFENRERKNISQRKPHFEAAHIRIPKEQRTDVLAESLADISGSDDFSAELFPLDALLAARELSCTKKTLLLNNLKKKTEDFLLECKKMLL